MKFELNISTDDAKEFAQLSNALSAAMLNVSLLDVLPPVREPYQMKPRLAGEPAPVGVPAKMRKSAATAQVPPPAAAAEAENDLSDYDEDTKLDDFGDDEEDERPPVAATVPTAVKKKKAKAAPVEADEELEDDEEPVAEVKRGRGRPPKDAAPAPAAQKVKGTTFDLDKDVVPAFKAYHAAHGRDAAKKILAQFEVASVRDLAPTEFAAIMRQLRPKAA